MNDSSISAALVRTNRIPGYVTQSKDTVRVFRYQPERVELQLRNPRWYSTASLTEDQVRQIIVALQSGLAELESCKADLRNLRKK